MAYKRYIKRGGKLYGPYVYHSKKTEGRVTSEYRGKISSDRNLIFLIIGLSLLFLLIFLSTFDIKNSSSTFAKNIVGLTVEDEQNENLIETGESENVASIRFVIEIIAAEHLDNNRNFVSDIYSSVKELDDIWSEPILDGEYARITFEQNLTSENDITIYPRIISGNPRIEVYEKDENNLVAEFINIISNQYNKVLLTNLQGSQDIFDLRVLDGSVEIDYIFDPVQFGRPNNDFATGSWSSTNATFFESVDEVSSNGDNDYVSSSTDEDELDLNITDLTDPVGNVSHILQFVAKSPGGSGPGEKAEMHLFEGLTERATTANTGIDRTAYETVTYTLSAAEAESITDYTNLFLRIHVHTIGGGEEMRVSQMEFQVPAAADTQAPKWFNNQTNGTTAGTHILHSVNWTDDTALSGYIFSFDNGTGTLVNDSFVEFSGSSNWSNVTKFVNQTVGTTIQWRIYANDSSNNLNSTDIFNYTTTSAADTTSPQITIDSPTNTTFSTGGIDYNITLDEALHTAFYSVDSGANNTLDNDTNLHYFNISGNHPTLAEGFHNITFWVNDTLGNANESTVFFTVDLTPPTITIDSPTNTTFGTGDIDYNITLDEALHTAFYSVDSGSNFTLDNDTNTHYFNISSNHPTLADGFHNITFWVNDTAGNANESTVFFTVDTTPPTITIDSPTNTTSSTGAIDYNITLDEALHTAFYSLDSGSNLTLDNDTNTHYFNISSNHPSLSDGFHNITFWVNDTSGNANKSTVFFTVDTTPPTITFVSPTNTTFSTGSIDYNITLDEALHTAYFSVDNGNNLTMDNDSNTNFFNLSSNHPALIDGFHNITFWVNDTFGNANESTVFFTVDTTNPLIDFVAPTEVNNSNFSRDWIFVNVSVTEINFANITFRLYNSTSQVNTTTYTSEIFEINFTNLVDETYTYNVTIVDDASNQNSTETRFMWLDTTPPQISFIAPTEANGTSVNRDWIFANVSVTEANFVNITYLLQNASGIVNETTYTTLVTSINWTNLNQSSVDYFYNVSVYDAVPNSNKTETRTITLITADTTPPQITIDSPTNTTFSTGGIDYNITLNEALHTAFYSVDSGSNFTLDNDTNTHYFNISSNHPSLADGFHNITFWVNDSSGNANESTVFFTVDTTAPQITIDSPTNTTFSTGGIDYNITLNEVLHTAFYSIDEGANLTLDNDTNTHYFNISSNHPSLADGFHNITFWINDTAGNANESTVFFTVDTTPPTITFVSPTNTTFSKGSIDYNITLDEALHTAFYSIDEGANLTLDNDSTTNYFNLSGNHPTLSDGFHNITFWVNDTLGNANESTLFFTVNILPKWFDNSTNSTIAGTNVLHSVRWTDDTALSGYIFSFDNGTGTFVNDSFVEMTGTNNHSNVTKFINNTVGTTIQWRVYTNDSSNNLNSTDIFVYNTTTAADTDPPDITIDSPTNKTFSTGAIDYNITLDEALHTAFYSIDSGSNLTLDNDSNTNYFNLSGNHPTLAEGFHNITFWVNDTSGNANESTVFFTVDLTAPNVQFETPTTATGNFSQNFIEANVTASDSLAGLDTITIRLYNSTSLVQTNTSQTSPLFVNFTGLPDETYTLNATANDTVNNENSTETRTIVLDNTSPTTNYVAPTENDGVLRSRDYIEINVTATDDNLDSIIIRLYNSTNDQINSSLTTSSPNFINFTNLADGLYFYNATANDTLGQETDLATRNITLDTTNPLINYTSPTEQDNANVSRDWVFVNVSVTEANEDTITFTLFNSTSLVNETSFTDSTRTINFTSLPDETYTYNVTVVDEASNENSTETRTITLDATIPLISFISPTENNNTAFQRNWILANVSVTETNFANITFRLYNSTSQVNVTIYTTLVTSINWTSQPDETYTYNVTVVDTVNNENSTETRFVTLDTINPALVLFEPQNITYTTTSLWINFTVSDANLDTCWYTNDSGASNNTLASCANATYTASQGSTTIRVYANDSADNLNSSSVTFFVDSINPLISFIDPTAGNGTSVTQNWIFANVSVTETNFKNITYLLQNASGIVNQTTYATLITEINWTNLNNSNVDYFYNVTVYDTVNNTNKTETRTLTLIEADTTPPTITIIFPENKSYNVNVTDLNYSAFDAVGLDSCWFSRDLGVTNSSPDSTCSNFTDVTSLVGNNTWIVYANDTSGNENSTSISFTKDLTNPTIDFVAPTEANDSSLTRNYIQVNVTASDETNLDTITIYLYNSTALVQTNTSTTSAFFVNFTGLPDETYYFNSTANDTANNVNTTETRTVTTDTGAPVMNYVSPTETSEVFRNQDFVLVNVTASDPNLDSIVIRLYNSSNDEINSSTTTTSPNFINFTGLSDGLYFYNATANDTVGNNANLTTRNITLDTTNPDIILNSPINNTSFNVSTINFSVSVSDNGKIKNVSLYIDGVLNQTNSTEIDSGEEGNYTGTSFDTADSENTDPRGITDYNDFFWIVDLTGDKVYKYFTNGTYANESFDTGSVGNAPSGITDYNDFFWITDLTDAEVYKYFTNGTYANESFDTAGSENTLPGGIIDYNDSFWITDIADSEVYKYDLDGTYTGVSFDTAGSGNTLPSGITDYNDFFWIVDLTGDKVYKYFTNGTYANESFDTGSVNDNPNGITDYHDFFWITALNDDEVYKYETGFVRYEFNDITLSNGNYNWTSDAYDTADNLVTTDILNFSVSVAADTTSPTITFVSPTNKTFSTGSIDYNITLDEALHTAFYSIDSGLNLTLDNDSNTNYFNLSLNHPTLADGFHNITFWVNDTVGNANETTLYFTTDTTSPQITIDSPTNTTFSTGDIDYNITLDESLHTAFYSVDGGSNLSLDNDTNTNYFNLSGNHPTLAEGFHNITFWVNDTLGNANESTVFFTVDTTLPTITIDPPTNTTFSTGDIDYNITLDEALHTAFFSVDSGSNLTLDNDSNTNYFNLSGNHPTLSDGFHNITFWVNDTAGNANESTLFFTVNILPQWFDNSTNSTIAGANVLHSVRWTDDTSLSGYIFGFDNGTGTLVNDSFVVMTGTNNHSNVTKFINNTVGTTIQWRVYTNDSSNNLNSTDIFNFSVSAEETPAVDVSPAGGGGGTSGGSSSSVECLNDSACNVDYVCFNYQCVKLFDVKIIDFESPIKLGEFFDFTYFVKGAAEINGDVEIDFWIEKDGEIITSGKDVIYLGSFEEKTETTKLFLPSNFEPGVYEFHIRVSHPSYSAESYRTIEVLIDEGVATIIPIEIKGLRIYAVIALIILAIIILSLIFYLERKKIKAGLIREERWVKKHKISVLAFSLFVVLGILAYSLNLFNTLLLWIKTPSFAYVLKIVLAVFVLLIAIFVARKINLFEKLKIWRIKRRGIRLLKEQTKRERLKLLHSKSKPKRIKLIKAKPKALTIKYPGYGRQFKKAFFSLANVSIRLLEKIFKIPSKLGVKLFENLKIFLRIIKKKLKLIFDESKNLEKTFFNFVKLNLSLIFKSKKSEKKVKKLRKYEPVKKPKQKIRVLPVIKKGLNSIYLFFNEFYKKSILKITDWSGFLLKLLKKTSRKYHIPKLGIEEKISRFRDLEKMPKHLIPEETRKEIRETFSLKSTIILKIRKLRLKSFELIQRFIDESVKNINNSIKYLGNFVSKKREDIARERRKVTRKTERTIEEIYEEIFYLLRGLFGNKSYANMIQDFKKTLVEGKNFTKKHLKILESLEENKLREFRLAKLRIHRNIDNLGESARREFRLANLRIHRNIDNLRNESEALVEKLVNYSQKLDKKEREKISKTISLSKRRSTNRINNIKDSLRNASIAIRERITKMQISYLRGIYNLKMIFFKEKRDIIGLVKDLENRELTRIKEDDGEKIRKILEQSKEANRRKFFEKKVFGEGERIKKPVEKPKSELLPKVELIPKEEPVRPKSLVKEQQKPIEEKPKSELLPKVEIIPKEELVRPKPVDEIEKPKIELLFPKKESEKPEQEKVKTGDKLNQEINKEGLVKEYKEDSENIIEDIAKKEREKGKKL